MKIQRLTPTLEFLSDHPDNEDGEKITFYKEGYLLLCNHDYHFLVQIDLETLRQAFTQLKSEDEDNTVKLNIDSQVSLVLQNSNLGDPYRSGVVVSLESSVPSIEQAISSVFIEDSDLRGYL